MSWTARAALSDIVAAQGCVRIDQDVDALGGEIFGEPLAAAEAADPQRDALRRRRGGAAGERQRHREIVAARELLRKLTGFRGTAEDKDTLHGVCRPRFA